MDSIHENVISWQQLMNNYRNYFPTYLEGKV